jgi:hypothetical protein
MSRWVSYPSAFISARIFLGIVKRKYSLLSLIIIYLSKIAFTAIAVNFALTTAFAAGIPGNCSDEIIALSKGSGFDMQAFMSSLPPAVAKAKLRAKAPFGQPKDSDKMDIGMTFGCLKAFPESPSEIQSLLKDISLKAVSGVATNQLYANEQETPPEPYQYQQAQVSQSPPPQAQYPYPPPPVQPQYPPPQVFYIYVPQPVQQTQCPQAGPENFSTAQRWGTWFLNTVFPGLGSAIIMEDYVGMGIQMGLTGLGIIFFISYNVCLNYHDGDECRIFLPDLGFASLGASAIFSIIRSYSYGESKESYTSKNHNGFNLAVMPNRHGEIMPYLLYNKTF